MGHKFLRSSLLALGLSLLVTATGFAQLDRLTTSQELALGQRFAQAVEQQFPLLRDPVLEWYLNMRGRQLAERSERNDIPYFFSIVDSSEINAFAVPGGHIYINLGIFQAAENEAEFLSIVAHEIAHIVARHSAERIMQQQWASIAQRAAIGAYPNYYAYLAGNLFGQLGFLKMSRDDEREADEVGRQILVTGGYDPMSMVEMFQKMRERNERNPNLLEKWFSTHPTPQERVDDLRQQIEASDLPDDLIRSSERWEEIASRVKELYPEPEPEEEEGKKRETAETDGEGDDQEDQEDHDSEPQSRKEGNR